MKMTSESSTRSESDEVDVSPVWLFSRNSVVLTLVKVNDFSKLTYDQKTVFQAGVGGSRNRVSYF